MPVRECPVQVCGWVRVKDSVGFNATSSNAHNFIYFGWNPLKFPSFSTLLGVGAHDTSCVPVGRVKKT